MKNAMLTAAMDGQAGIFTRRQAADAGFSAAELKALLAHGDARRIARGVFSLADASSDPMIDHAERVIGQSMAYGGRIAASHHSALVLFQLPTFDVDLGQTHFIRLSGGDSLHTSDTRIVRSSIRLPTIELRGVVSVTPAVAVAQTARDVSIEAAVMAADDMVRRKIATIDDLTKVADLMRRTAGAGRVRQTIDLIDARSESPYESLVRVIATSSGIELEPQFVVTNGSGEFLARVDFRVAGTRTLIEYDGAGKYDRPQALYDEKKREDALRAEGWRVVRLVKSDVVAPYRFLDRLR